jgi:hypothetical protein
LIVHENPDEAVRNKLLALEQIKSKSKTKHKQAFRMLCTEDLWFLIRAVLDWHFLDEELHGKELLSFASENQDKDQLIILPRGHVKTLFSGARIIQRILKNPSISILAASATEDLAKGIGSLVGNTLLTNDKLQWAFSDILPSSSSECEKWGMYAYTLPGHVRRARLEPTLMLASVGKNITGYHPDEIYLDDITVDKTNTPEGWNKAVRFIDNCLRLLPPNGVFRWNQTRYHDSDPAGRAMEQKIVGKQGFFQCLSKSCFKDDDPKKDPIYPLKKRWTAKNVSGFSKEGLLREMSVPDPQSRHYFSCQMRNNPVPEEDQVIQIKDIDIYKPEDMPEFGHCLGVGVEITGGGRPVYTVIEEMNREQGVGMPLRELAQKSQKGGGKMLKSDKIVAALEPITREGRLKCRAWMIPTDMAQTDNLGYEIRRLGAAKHDDIADALHMVPSLLAEGLYPPEKYPAHLYISCDLAYSESKKADHTVFMAVCVDSQNNFWVLDYIRFQAKSPTVIGQKLISFYMKWSLKSKGFKRGGKSHSFAQTYR